MRLQSLRVIHLPKSSGFDFTTFDGAAMIPGAFHLASCQRWLWVCTVATLDAAFGKGGAQLPEIAGLEIHEGADAYLLLLRVATGLESQIVGETDIFGQFKEAWAKADIPHGLKLELGPWMQRLFEDTKEVRSRFLQNLGGASYGTLVRKMIREHAKDGRQGPILIIGAGQIARSIVPYLEDQEIWIWNRTKENLATFHQEILALNPEAQVRVISDGEKDQAWQQAAHIVLCIPVDAARDSKRIALWSQNPIAERSVIHLGGYRSQCPEWATVQGFYSLDDLFQLQKAQGEVRFVQIARAGRACDERAKLRALGTSITLPHGWEDLAAFA